MLRGVAEYAGHCRRNCIYGYDDNNDDNDDNNDDDDNDDDADSDEDGGDDLPEDDASGQVKVIGESIPGSDLFLWIFPAEVSQSTLDNRNGSAACSVIALICAHGVWHQRLDLQPTPLLCPLWVTLLCSSIRVGNRLYDSSRHSLPQRYLSASEATTVVERCVSVSVESPLAVRVCDEHAPTTLLFQITLLCTGERGDAAVLIANEKTLLFIPVGNLSMVLVDTH